MNIVGFLDVHSQFQTKYCGYLIIYFMLGTTGETFHTWCPADNLIKNIFLWETMVGEEEKSSNLQQGNRILLKYVHDLFMILILNLILCGLT